MEHEPDIEFPKTKKKNRNANYSLQFCKSGICILIICKFVTIFVLIIVILIFIAVYLLVPLIFMKSVEVERLLIFTNINLETDPEAFNLDIVGIRNFQLRVSDYYTDKSNITLGVWHLVPTAIAANFTSDSTDADYDKALSDGRYPVILYFHGSGETRLDSREKYMILREFAHVITFDYRDFADSTRAPLFEQGIVRDALGLYNWLRTKTQASVLFYGHSLGTGISTHTVAELRKYEVVPRGLILEAPFTSLREEIPVHPWGKYFAWLPWFRTTILDPLDRNDLRFYSSKNILSVDCPIMVLHAEDDSVVPCKLGKKLVRIAETQRSSLLGNVTFHHFAAKFHYDHYFIYTSPLYPNYIDEFIRACDINKTQTQKIWTEIALNVD